jgi:hypothetical protein
MRDRVGQRRRIAVRDRPQRHRVPITLEPHLASLQSTPSSRRTALVICSAWSASRVLQVTSTTSWSGWDSTTSTAVTVPPACPMAVVTRPMPPGSESSWTRMVIE